MSREALLSLAEAARYEKIVKCEIVSVMMY